MSARASRVPTQPTRRTAVSLTAHSDTQRPSVGEKRTRFRTAHADFTIFAHQRIDFQEKAGILVIVS